MTSSSILPLLPFLPLFSPSPFSFPLPLFHSIFPFPPLALPSLLSSPPLHLSLQPPLPFPSPPPFSSLSLFPFPPSFLSLSFPSFLSLLPFPLLPLHLSLQPPSPSLFPFLSPSLPFPSLPLLFPSPAFSLPPPSQMSSVDPDGALKMYSQNGEWEKCLDLAQQQGAGILAKYVALYAADLIRKNAALSALQLFTKYGSPATPQNFNIYKHLCADVYKQSLEGSAGYSTYASLRNMLLSLVEEMSSTAESGSLHHREFERHLVISHYLATRTAFQDVDQLKTLVAKLSTSLLRHTDILPADKAFYESGLHCKGVGWDNMAFVFYNRFLDLSEVSMTGHLHVC